MNTAADFVPPHAQTLEKLREASKGCRGCDLYKYATQTVFGEGPQTARIMFLGQQPGDKEDKEGHPFVGPAGHLLDKALSEAGVNRSTVYISNVVKHFKYLKKGNFRFHQKPTSAEIHACRPWLEAEIQLIRPEVIVCMGVSAAEWVLDRKVSLFKERGRLQDLPAEKRVPLLDSYLLITPHPASILRIPEEVDRHAAYFRFVEDLKQILPFTRHYAKAA
jgi:uracil-DNA glycosylase family protein